MQVRRIIPLAALAVVAVGAFLPASAAPKPVTKAYAMHLYPGLDVCSEAALDEKSMHRETFTAPGPGTFTATIDGFQGDWDLSLLSAEKAEVAKGGGSSTGTAKVGPSEILIYKIKKAGTYTLTTCNYAGTLDAKGGYTFKPAK